MDIAKLVRILKICNSFSIQEADSQPAIYNSFSLQEADSQPFIIDFVFRKLITSHL